MESLRKNDWYLGEHIDCLDETGRWCNAEIVEVKC